MGHSNIKESVTLILLCLFAFILSFTWYIFQEIYHSAVYLFFGPGDGFCVAGQPCMLPLSLLPYLMIIAQLLASILGAIFIHRCLLQNNLLAHNGLLLKAVKIFLLTIILFFLVVLFATPIRDDALTACYEECGGSVMCEAHCPAPAGAIFFIILISAIVGPHNPIIFFLVGYLTKQK